MENWFGLQRGKYIGEPPAYVDKLQKPGLTDVPKPTVVKWLRNAPFVLVTSPNFIWAIISLGLYLKPSIRTTAFPLSSASFPKQIT